MESALARRREELLIEEVSRTVESCTNPDIAKSILYLSRHTSEYVGHLPVKLGVSEAEVQAVLSELSEANLVRILEKKERWGGDEDLSEVWRVDEVNPYLYAPYTYGHTRVISAEGLDSDKVFNAMDKVKDVIQFSYSREFTFPLEQLEELRRQSHEALEPIRQKEEDFFYDVLGVPKNFSGFPTFVRDSDPTTNDNSGHGITRKNKFGFRGSFNSIEEAFDIGFDKAHGDLILKENQEEYKRRLVGLGILIERKSELYTLELINARYRANECTIACQREIQEVQDTVKERLEQVL